jgi:hypothetical protein
MSGDANIPSSYKEAENLAKQVSDSLFQPIPDLKKIMKEEAEFERETKIKPIELLEKLNEQTKELLNQNKKLGEQTDELITQNKKLSYLTVSLLILTGILVITTIISFLI